MVKNGYFLIGVVVAFILGTFVNGETKYVEKPVEKVVTVTQQCEDCKAFKDNLEICRKGLLLSGEVNSIAGEIFRNINVYEANPSLLTPKVDRLNEISREMTSLRAEIK